MSNPIVIAPKECKNLRWQPHKDLSFAANIPLIPLHAGELAKAATTMPLALTRDKQGWQLVGVCGLDLSHNLFVRDGKWLGNYQPQWLATWPFAVISLRNNQELVTFDRDSGLLVEQDGEPFFDDNQEPGTALQAVMEQIKASRPLQRATDKALKDLAVSKVITPWPQSLYDSLGLAIPGLHMIDEKALLSLDKDSYYNLRQAMPIAYAINMSIYQNHLLKRLAKHNPPTPSMPESLDQLFGEDDILRFR